MSKRHSVMLHPGEVMSKSDGEIHFIGAGQLTRLYDVRSTDDVVVYDPRNPTHDEEYEKSHGIKRVHLFPRYNGDYHSIHEKDDLLANDHTV